MKISTKGRYALRIMIDLAMNAGESPVRVKDIASRQNISEKYLEQIIALFNKAGYVKSIRGAQGGYLLTREPGEYTVGMILRLAEGSIAPVSCVGADAESCEKRGACVSAMLWPVGSVRSATAAASKASGINFFSRFFRSFLQYQLLTVPGPPLPE